MEIVSHREQHDSDITELRNTARFRFPGIQEKEWRPAMKNRGLGIGDRKGKIRNWKSTIGNQQLAIGLQGTGIKHN